MSPDTTRAFLEAYFERFPVENMKRILRSKHEGSAFDKSSIIPIPKKYEHADLQAMSEATNIKDALDLLKNTRYKKVIDALPFFQKYGLVSLIESFLDKAYYDSVVSPRLEALSDEQSVREVLGVEVDLLTIKTIIDLKARGVPQDVIRTACPKPVMLKREELTLIVEASLEETPEVVSRTRYGAMSQALRDALDAGKDESLERIVREQIFRRTKSMMRKYAENLAYVLGYVKETETEANNLVSIATGKELGLPEQKIETMLSF